MKRLAMAAVTLVVARQAGMAVSLYLLGMAGASVAAGDAHDAIYCLLGFFAFAVLAYLSSALTEVVQAPLQAGLWRQYCLRTLDEFRASRPLSTRHNREKLGHWLMSEAGVTLHDVVPAAINLLSAALNIGLALLVFSLLLGSEFLAAIAIASFLSLTLVVIFRRHTGRLANQLQQDRTRLNGSLSLAVTGSSVISGSSGLFAEQERRLSQNFREFGRTSLKHVILEQSLSTVPVVLSVVCVMVYVHGQANALTHTGEMIAVLPRVLQFFGIVHELSLVSSRSFFLARKASNLRSFISTLVPLNIEGEMDLRVHNLTHNLWITPQQLCDLVSSRQCASGRVLITGSNGAGKSTLLIRLTNLQDCLLLPAGDQIFAEEAGLSSGEAAKFRLDRILDVSTNLPPVLLLDEWDANLSKEAKAEYSARLDDLAADHLVIEVRH